LVTVADDNANSAGAAGVGGGGALGGAGGSVITIRASTGVGSAGLGSTGVSSQPVLVSQLTPEQSASLAAAACTQWSIEPESTPTKLELVIDVSSSMNNAAPGTDRSKWEVTRDALLEAVVGVTGAGLPDYVAVGLMLYPNKNTAAPALTPTDPSQCLNTVDAVPVAILGGDESGSHRSLIRQRFAQVSLGRGTPTVDAYDWALNHSGVIGDASAVSGDAYLLLMTDGMPTLNAGCWNPTGEFRPIDASGAAVVSAVDAAYFQSVKTFVVGLPGSEDGRSWMSHAAYVGGTGVAGCDQSGTNGKYCHLDLTTAADLSSALRQGLATVVRAVASCKFALPARGSGIDPSELSNFNPLIRHSDGSTYWLGRNPTADEDCSIGFRLDNNMQLAFCKDTCAEYRADPGASIQVLFGCSTADVQNLGLI
jgi:hypothetical protein